MNTEYKNGQITVILQIQAATSKAVKMCKDMSVQQDISQAVHSG